MDCTFNFRDIRVEKANATLKYRRVKRITTLFRFLELFIFIVILARVSSTQLSFSLNLSVDYFRGIFDTLLSQHFVFLIGNAIVITLFLISGPFSNTKDEKCTDFYDEYVEKCRKIEQTQVKEVVKTAPPIVNDDEKNLIVKRSKSEVFTKPVKRVERDLRRSMTGKYRKSVEKPCASHVEKEMSNEEFRQTVEAFIARQQRCLREEEEEEMDHDQFCSAVVSI